MVASAVLAILGTGSTLELALRETRSSLPWARLSRIAMPRPAGRGVQLAGALAGSAAACACRAGGVVFALAYLLATLAAALPA